MSAGGQRGIDVSGLNGLRIQHASDATHRIYLSEIFQNFSSVSANAARNTIPNATGYFLDFTQSRKEVGRRDISFSDCSTCLGLPYQYSTPLSFRF